MRRGVLICSLAVAGALACCAALGVRWNLSPSVDPGLYRERRRAAEHGDVVVVCLPETLGRWAKGRGYLGGGTCPGAAAPMGKRIVAVAGDRVGIRDREITVNGRALELSGRVDRDLRDRPVPRVGKGIYVLAPGEIWLHSGRHARGLDSRVFGPLDASHIHAVVEPVWVHGER